MKILAIETSCDETGVAVVEAKNGLKNPSLRVLSNITLSQIKIHAKWGGVVPSLAKEEHQQNLIPVFKKALRKSGLLIPKSEFLISKQTPKSKLQKIPKILEREPKLLEQFLKLMPAIQTPKIDAIAVTVGPGLEPALWAGINFARALALVWNKPVVAVNHMEGHISAVLLQNSRNSKHKIQSAKKSFGFQHSIFEFPTIALLVSGGHTELVLIKKWGNYKVIGQTRDDAAGECFDKTARMLELPYPSGQEIAKQAENFKKYPLNFRMDGGAKRKTEKEVFNIKLPRPMIDSKNYDFSFSGLKTAVLYMLKNMKERHINTDEFTPTICNEIQQAIIDVLIAKTTRAAKEFKVKTIILGGGVAANKELRRQMAAAVKKIPDVDLRLPAYKLTADNAAMIAAAGYLRALKRDFADLNKIKARGNLSL